MNKSFLTLCCLSFLSFSSIHGQNDLKSWNSAQLGLSFTKKLDLHLGYMRAYNISNGFSHDFNQFSAHIDYDLTKKFSLSAGAVLGSLSAADGSNRVTLRGTIKTHVAGMLSWSNSIQGEIHSELEPRY